jgi:hypothetical protein
MRFCATTACRLASVISWGRTRFLAVRNEPLDAGVSAASRTWPVRGVIHSVRDRYLREIGGTHAVAYRRLLKQAWSGVTRKFVSRLHHLNDAVAALSINLEAGESAIRQRPLLADTGGSRSRPSDPVTALFRRKRGHAACASWMKCRRSVLTRPGCSSATQCPAPGTKSTFSSLVHVLRMSSNAPGYVPQMTGHRAWLV